MSCELLRSRAAQVGDVALLPHQGECLRHPEWDRWFPSAGSGGPGGAVGPAEGGREDKRRTLLEAIARALGVGRLARHARIANTGERVSVAAGAATRAVGHACLSVGCATCLGAWWLTSPGAAVALSGSACAARHAAAAAAAESPVVMRCMASPPSPPPERRHAGQPGGDAARRRAAGRLDAAP